MSSKINLQKPPTAQGSPGGECGRRGTGLCARKRPGSPAPAARALGRRDAHVSGGTGLHVLGSSEHRPHFGHEILHGEMHGVPVASRSDPACGQWVQERPKNTSVGQAGWGRRSTPVSVRAHRWGRDGGAEGKPASQRRGVPLYLSYFALHRGDNCRGDLAIFFLRNSPNVNRERSQT